MRDISTDDLVQTLIIKTEAHERARCIYAVHPTAQNAKAVTARARDQKNALRALATHIKDCVRMMQSMRTVKMPPGYVNLRGKIPARTVNALKAHGIKHPEGSALESLLRIPGVGVQGVASIAQRAYANHSDPVRWPELED